MNKTITLLSFFMLLSMSSCKNDDDHSFSNFTPSARIDRIVFTEIPIFTITKPSDYNYFSFVTNSDSSINYPNEIVNLKDELVYNESTGIVTNLVFTYDNYIILSNSGSVLQTNTLFGISSTNHVNDLDNLTNITLTEIYQYDNAETFEKSYSVEINSSSTLVDNAEGSYNFTVYGTFIYD